MSPPNDDDRAAILARRAAFITSTLSLLHCSPAREQVASPSTSSTSATIDSSRGTASPTPADTARPLPTGLRSFADALAAAPPRGAPAELPDGIREAARDLEQQLDTVYTGVKLLWVPPIDLCDAAEPSCKDAWRAIGERTMKLRDQTREMNGGMCGRWAGQLGTLEKRRLDHRAFIGSLLDEVDDRYARVAAAMSARGEQEWLKIAANAKVTPPMPCLKCAPPERLSRSADVGFDDGSATLGKANDAGLAQMLDEVRRGRDQRIELVGHADPGEKGDLLMLSTKRAEVIAQWLTSKGVPSSNIRVLGLGAMLPVSKEASANRRVESGFLRAR